MELPISDTSYDLPYEALVRAVRRVAVALGRTGSEEVELDGAMCLISQARPRVRALNFAEHLAVAEGETEDSLLDRIEAAFAAKGSSCHAWCTDGAWPDPLAAALERRGLRRIRRHVLCLDPGRVPPEADAGLQIIPVRAAYRDVRRFYVAKAVEAHAADEPLAEALAGAWIDRLDEPRLEMNLVRCDGEIAVVAGVFSLGEIGVISPAYCAPAYRGRGVAAAAMTSVLEHCRRAQFKHVVVDRGDGCPAIRFYQRFGFSHVTSYDRYRR